MKINEINAFITSESRLKIVLHDRSRSVCVEDHLERPGKGSKWNIKVLIII